MFACLLDETSDTEASAMQGPSPKGPDTRSMEINFRQVLKPNIVRLVEEDNAEGLEEALLGERTSESAPCSKRGKKKNRQNDSKEEDEFSTLARRVFRYACALDSVKCCKILLASEKQVGVWVDEIDEVDQRSGLHVASFHHSHRCVDLLLKQGANISILNKYSMTPLEEALLSPRLSVDWDFSTSAAEIVKRVGEKDLRTLKTLGLKCNCKDQLASLAFKLGKGLKLVPLVALLLVRRSIVNVSIKGTGSDEDSGGTIVDYLLGKVLASSPPNNPDKVPEKISMHKKLKLGDAGDSGSGNHKQILSPWDHAGPEIKHRKDITEWEQINSKYRTSLNEVEAGKRTIGLPKSLDRMSNNCTADKLPTMNDDLESNHKFLRKLLECALHFVQSWKTHSRNSSMPPLLRAVQANDGALVNALLEAGAPVNDIDNDGNTALHWALRQATPVNGRSVNSVLVERLLDAGANVTAGNNLGATPIHTAAGHGHVEALYLIIKKHGGSINILAGTKETPLHYAVKNNHLACAALLLRHGANRDVISLRNQKPFQLASTSEMRALLSLDEKVLCEEYCENLMQFSFPSVVHSSAISLIPAQESSPMNHLSSLSSPPMPHKHLAQSSKHPSSFCQTNDLAVSSPPSVGLTMTLSFSQAPATASEHCSIQSTSQFQPLSSSSSWEANQGSNSFSWQTVHKSFRKHTHSSGSHSTDVEMLNTKATVSLPPYKTVSCRFFGTSTKCAWGNKCHFAHSEEELLKGQQLLMLLGPKVEATQGIPAGADNSEQGVKNYKTKLCMHYEKNGCCPHKSKCIFAHGEGELRTTPSSSSLGSCPRHGPRPSTASSFGSCCSEEIEDVNARKIFVGGLPPYVDAKELREFIEEEFGKVINATVICSNDVDGIIRSRGFGFVLFGQQKDADEAVRRHYLPFHGKKVEIKKALGGMDLASGDEGAKQTSFFSNMSSPAARQPPAFASASSGVSLYDDGLHHGSWSPSLSFELSGQLSQDDSEMLQPTASQSEPQISAEKYEGHFPEHTTSMQNNEQMDDCQKSGYLLPYVCAEQRISENSSCSGRGGLCSFTKNAEWLFKADDSLSGSSFHPYSLCSSSSLSSMPFPSMSSVSSSFFSNGNNSMSPSSHQPFTYYYNTTSDSYFSTMPDSLPEVKGPNKTDGEDEEFSQLLGLLEVSPSFKPQHTESSTCKTPSMNHGFGQVVVPASIANGWSGDYSFSTCQNMDSKFVNRNSLYTSNPENLYFESQLLCNLQYPYTTERIIDAGHALNDFCYDRLLPEGFGCDSAYQLPAWSHEPSRVLLEEKNDPSFQRFTSSRLTQNLWKPSNTHVQDFKNSHIAGGHDAGQYSRFGTSI